MASLLTLVMQDGVPTSSSSSHPAHTDAALLGPWHMVKDREVARQAQQQQKVYRHVP